MKIFSASQIKQWDQYTIAHEPVASIDLMERAAAGCVQWITGNTPPEKNILIFCGPGNNGGDGLAIARMLQRPGRRVTVFILKSAQYSDDFSVNLRRLQSFETQPTYIETTDDLPFIHPDSIVVDALYGYGLNRPLEGIAATLVKHLNQSGAEIISIDIASGLFADQSTPGNSIILPAHTLSFQVFKLAFLLPENEPYTGCVHIIDIGLHPEYCQKTEAAYEMVSETLIRSFYTPRSGFSHKGNYGNLLLVSGSYGMMGAAVLAARACLRSGAGKLTCYIPACGYAILQSDVPEAMCLTDEGERHIEKPAIPDGFDGYAVGPGLGSYPEGALVMEQLFAMKPARLVADADALNILAGNSDLKSAIPTNTILTPHPKEFERLFGKTTNHFERLKLALETAQSLQIYIVLKGKYSLIATPSGKGYFNTTGNPGMATGGSGDVLTGILLGLSAQYRDTEQAVLTGVYLHGLSGDFAADEKTPEAMVAGDLVEYLPAAFKKVFYYR